MRTFRHVDARSVEEACALLEEHGGRAVLNAGGTDLLSVLKRELLSRPPSAVVNLKTIPGLDAIRADGDALRIGALTPLRRIVTSPLLVAECPVLVEAARSVASPQVRNAATLGGNLCQDVRCWYYRYPRKVGGPLDCARKGRGPCLAVKGDNRYHAVLGGKRCFAVCPSDTAVALAALDARIRIAGPNGSRTLGVEEFYHPLGNALAAAEMVAEVELPRPALPMKQVFLKYTLRRPIDFAVVSVAAALRLEGGRCAEGRIALGAVAPGPVRATGAEAFLRGRPLDEGSAAEAARVALAGARALSGNAYKIEIAKALVERALERTAG